MMRIGKKLKEKKIKENANVLRRELTSSFLPRDSSRRHVHQRKRLNGSISGVAEANDILINEHPPRNSPVGR